MSDLHWRLLRDGPADGAWNMAVDETIARAVGEGRVPPTLRFYGWSRPTVSLGYSQRSDGAVDPGACKRLGIDIVRRPTGGRAVLHVYELTYSAAVPTNGSWGGLSVRESFLRMGQALIVGLKRLGVAATVEDGKGGRSALPRTSACFQMLRMPAILVGGRKLIGSAQRRWEGTLLQHGSLLLQFDAAMHQAVFPTWPRDPTRDVVWLAGLLGGLPPRSAVEAALAAGWADVMGAVCAPGTLAAEERRQAEVLVQTRYGNAAWTHQR
jgi:lipoate-protein ligase A